MFLGIANPGVNAWAREKIKTRADKKLRFRK
jgi:hypothetical protein